MTNKSPSQNDELRRLYALSCSGDDGPSDEELIALVSGDLDEASKERVLERLLESPDAAARFRVLREIQAGAVVPARRRLPAWLATAAVIPLAAVLLVLLHQPADELRIRGQGDTASPSGMAVIDTPPVFFDWTAPSDRTADSIQLYSEEATLLWSDDAVTVGRYDLADTKQGELVDGVYFWTVTLDDGSTLGPYWFRIQ